MKWTAERIEAVRALAASGASQGETAAKFGVSAGTIAGIASRYKIRFGQPKPAIPPPESRQFIDIANEMMAAEREAARNRWLADMPRLRANVRAAAQAEVDAMAAGAPP